MIPIILVFIRIGSAGDAASGRLTSTMRTE